VQDANKFLIKNIKLYDMKHLLPISKSTKTKND